MNSNADSSPEQEAVIWTGHSSQLVNFATYLVCGFFCLLIIALAIAGTGLSLPFSSFLLLGLLIVPLSIMLWKWIANRCRHYEVTTERIRLRTGIFSRKTDEVELYRVKDYTLVEPFWQRVFGLGSIRLATTDDANPQVMIEAIPKASDLRDQIRKYVEICRRRHGVRVTEFE